MTSVRAVNGQFDLSNLGRAIYARRRSATTILALSVIIGVGISFLLPLQYESRTSLSPAPSSTDRLPLGGTLATLGGQLGIDLSGATGRTQLRFYPDLLRSYWLLSRLAMTTKQGDTALFDVLLGAPSMSSGTPTPAQMDRVVTLLRKSIQVDVDDRSNIFTVSVRLPTRGLALAAAERLIGLVTEFDTRVRRSRASENRRFLETRTDSAEVMLGAAEDEFVRFEQRNRTFAQSPDLNLQHERLQRRVALLQDVYLSLARNLEQARIDEVKETPVLTIVDPPHVRWRKVEPRRAQVVAAALAFGALAILALGFLPTTWRESLESLKR